MKNSYVISACVVVVTTIVCFTAVALTDNDATELRTFINTLLNFAAPILIAAIGGPAIYFSRKAANNTNGDLHSRLDAIETAIRGREEQ